MGLEQLTPLDAIKQFPDGTQAVAFNVATDKRERYHRVQKILVKHRYLQPGKTERGTVTRYLMKVTGYSLAQTRPAIGTWRVSRFLTCTSCGPPGLIRGSAVS